MSKTGKTFLQRLINRRRAVQVGLGVLTWLAVAHYGISLWWVVAVGSLSGIVLGKYFCRWACPMGAMMEVMLDAGGDKQGALYAYFKLGCPIAWFGGLLNKVSFLRVKLDESKCVECGLCDKACYVSQLSKNSSLFQGGAVNSSTHYSCSRCLQCVTACPSHALTLGPSMPLGTTLPGSAATPRNTVP